MSGDPLRLLWDALEAQGYRPRGKVYEFRARCPGHDGDNPTSLSVRVGADGRAVLWCHAHQCDVKTITSALGLQVVDLFPDGHYRGRRYPVQPLKRSDFAGAARTVANVLHALEEIGENWKLMISSDCPCCGSMGGSFRANSDGHVDADCPEGCNAENYVRGLLGRSASPDAPDSRTDADNPESRAGVPEGDRTPAGKP
jgi:hypothetical protein